jgi:molybdopterin converting factor small subunit
MSNLTLTIQCFGAFRQFGECLSMEVNDGVSISQLKEALIQQLGDEHKLLVRESVLANDNDVLPNTYIIKEDTPLSILPPVCGG